MLFFVVTIRYPLLYHFLSLTFAYYLYLFLIYLHLLLQTKQELWKREKTTTHLQKQEFSVRFCSFQWDKLLRPDSWFLLPNQHGMRSACFLCLPTSDDSSNCAGFRRVFCFFCFACCFLFLIFCYSFLLFLLSFFIVMFSLNTFKIFNSTGAGSACAT